MGTVRRNAWTPPVACDLEELVTAAVLEAPALEADDLEGLGRADATRILLERAASTTSPDVRAALEQRVVGLNMPVAAQVAGRYRSRGVSIDDLEQVAYLALVKAAQRYEFTPERDFLSFAVPTIRGELKRYFRDFGWTVRPTRRVQEAQARITRAENELLQTFGRSPRPSEIAQHLDMDPDLVIEALSADGCFQPSSLDFTSDTDAEVGPAHHARCLREDEAGFERVETLATLKPVLADLDDRERLMVEMRFFHNATQAQIGEALGISQMQVSRSLSALMTRLREKLSHWDGRATTRGRT